MTQMDLIRKYGVDYDVAELVEEYLRETGECDDTFLTVAVNTVVTACKTHQEITGDIPTLEELKAMYYELPSFITGEYGDKFLLGYISFLMQGRTI